MLKANLYVDRIDLAPYLTPEEGRLAGPTAARWRPGSRRAAWPEDCPWFGPPSATPCPWR